MIFVYDFPHKKTQDFIFRLITEGYHISYVIAAPWKKLSIPPSTIKIDQKHTGLIHPRTICQRFKIKYLSTDHNSQPAITYVKKYPVDLYIIAGARILSKKLIEACHNKVLNIHPGLLPEIRGLDTFQWSIYYKSPLGISAHFIVPKIDSGQLIYKENLQLFKNDTPLDVTLRLLEHQTEVLVQSLKLLKKTKLKDLPNLSNYHNAYNTKMDPKLEKKVIGQFNSWLNKFADE